VPVSSSAWWELFC